MEDKLRQIREAIEKIVVTSGQDSGVILLSNDGPTHLEKVGGTEIRVFDHEHFSELGDALIALHRMCGGGDGFVLPEEVVADPAAPPWPMTDIHGTI